MRGGSSGISLPDLSTRRAGASVSKRSEMERGCDMKEETVKKLLIAAVLLLLALVLLLVMGRGMLLLGTLVLPVIPVLLVKMRLCRRKALSGPI